MSTKAFKQDKVSQIKENIDKAQVAIVTEYKGYSVEEITNLRRALQKEGGDYMVTKNTLAKIAVKMNDFEAAQEYYDEFLDIAPYDNQKYKTPGFEKHHGVLNEWAEHNIPGYTKKNAPTILLKPETHKLTKEIYREWLRKNYGKPVGVTPNWRKISKTEIMELVNDMFDAASVPQNVRNEYFELFVIFIMKG